MSAFCGVLHDDARALAPVLAQLGAYGPHSDTWEDDGVAFGTRYRVEASDAELRSGGSAVRVAVAGDCRLDNRAELCDALGIRSADRSGHTNGELLLRAWLRWREACPTRLLGDYAFVVWDATRRTLFCCRDPVGVKPFYYALTPRRFAFASSVDAVLAAPFVGNEFDDATVAAYLTRVILSSPIHTFFRAVRKLPPGHFLTVTCAPRRLNAKLLRYWRPEDTPRAAKRASDDDHAEEFRHLYRQAVACRLPTTGRVGTHLSGGFDSSSVTVLTARELAARGQAPPVAFSWLPDVDRHARSAAGPEYRLVESVCEQERLRVFHRAPGVDDIVATLAQDGALPGVHIHLNEHVAQRAAASEGVTTLLSGWGGDEGVSFHGRGRNAHLLLSGRWQLLLAHRDPNYAAFRFLANTLLNLALPEHAHILRARLRGKDLPRKRWLIDPAFARRTKRLPQPAPRFVGVRRTQLWLLKSGGLAERMEGWAASGAWHGIQYRYPLLDLRLLEFALSLPPEQFKRPGADRWLMRHALGPLLPLEVRESTSKADPVRFQAVKRAFFSALPVVRQRLAQRAQPPARAPYIDMPRLRERLATEPSRVWTHMTPVRAALQFLDF